jgi:uncharacterized protein (TIGR02145 family)
MKKLLTLFAVVVTMTAMAQSVAISDDGSVADGSAILELKSTTKGFLLPRMTAEQRDDITGAVAGLQIWCTDCGPTAAMYFYNGSEWSTGETGITSEQATAITDNSKKVGITPEQADIIANTSGSNTGDQDLSDLASAASVNSGLATKVDKVDGMGLSREDYGTAEKTKLGSITGINTGDKTLSELGGVASNDAIEGESNTKITYDAKGLVTAGADATTADIVEITDKKYVTDAQVEVLGNTSGANTGDNATNTQYSGLDGSKANLTGATFTGAISSTNLSNSNTGDETDATIKTKLSITTLSGANTGDNATNTQLTVLVKTSGANTGDNATNTQYSDQARLIASLQAQINAFVTEYGEPLPSVAIGTQKWMNKNLDVATYRDGTPIPEVADRSAWAVLKTGAWCYYNNDSANETTYSKLYNWYAVAGIYDAASLNDSSLRKQLAPTGWHVPSDGEWTTLTDALGGGSVAGGKMKETGTAHWEAPNEGATNSSGFTGLPGGYRYYNGAFNDIGDLGTWWSSTGGATANAWYRSLNFNFGDVNRGRDSKTFGFSVRCLRD